MRTMAVIPSRYEPERLHALLPLLDADEVVVLDNGHQPAFEMEGVRVVDSRGLSIYAMWNRGWATARHEGYEALALLNDDITVLPGTLRLLERALWSDKRIGVTAPDKYVPLETGMPAKLCLDVVTDPARERTLTGFAFMARLTMFEKPPFDESWHWWFGDDAFDEKVRRAGYGIARVIGLPIAHESDSERDGWARRPELKDLAEQDAVRWTALHEAIA
jgi:GT2 family glycosyltransferase